MPVREAMLFYETGKLQVLGWDKKTLSTAKADQSTSEIFLCIPDLTCLYLFLLFQQTIKLFLVHKLRSIFGVPTLQQASV